MDFVSLTNPQGDDSVVDGDKTINEFKDIIENFEAKIKTGHPIVNIYTGDVEDLERAYELLMNDNTSRIDFVLVWPSINPLNEVDEHSSVIRTTDPKSSDKARERKSFEDNLKLEGLICEHDIEEGRKFQFTKVHAPIEVLTRYGELLKLRLPIEEVPEYIPPLGIWDMMEGVIAKILKVFELNTDKVPVIPKRYSYIYERNKKYLFSCAQNELHLFSHATRIRIVDYILRRKEYSKQPYGQLEYGIKRLLSKEAYLAAYPLHEGNWKKKSRSNIRKLLYDNWANWRSWYKMQPLQYIRVYFGEKVGIYFAWLGYYTYTLVAPSIIGFFVFIYGIASVYNDPISIESCSIGRDYVMCPLCNRYCSYWSYDQICFHTRANHIFDNNGTVFFAIFMAFWATLYLEFWKREQAAIQFNWDLKNFEEEEEPPRPEYYSGIVESNYKKINKQTGAEESFFPFWRRQVPVYLTSTAIMLSLVLLALATVIGIIVYRISILAALYMTDNPTVYRNANIVVTATAACINLIIIFILDFIYTKVAIFLTDWECLKTQSEYDNSLTLKLYVLQFVNFYSTLFYIAFFKGKFAGSPNNYLTLFNGRQEECQGSCLTELCIQLAIIFVGKQLIQNTLMEIYIPRIRRWIIKTCFTSKEERRDFQRKKPWEKDYVLNELGTMGLFTEYLEMMIQFGFVTIFVAAFPLAPFFACMNNVIEVRSDANKFVTQLRRAVPTRAADIGIWFDILYGISRLAILTNALIIAFTSNFIERELYTRMFSDDGSLYGFLNNSLSYFNVSDFSPSVAPVDSVIKPRYNETELCRYHDYREPPWSPRKYERTSQYWNLLAAKFIFICVFENVIILVVGLIAYIVPDVSGRVRRQLREETILTNEILLATELKRAKGDYLPLSDKDMMLVRMRVSAADSERSPIAEKKSPYASVDDGGLRSAVDRLSELATDNDAFESEKQVSSV